MTPRTRWPSGSSRARPRPSCIATRCVQSRNGDLPLGPPCTRREPPVRSTDQPPDPRHPCAPSPPGFSLVIAVAAGVPRRAGDDVHGHQDRRRWRRNPARRHRPGQRRDHEPGLDTIDLRDRRSGRPDDRTGEHASRDHRARSSSDGTTQAGGAVQISGGGTLDGGLLLSGGGSTVRGLVVERLHDVRHPARRRWRPHAGRRQHGDGCIVGLDRPAR